MKLKYWLKNQEVVNFGDYISEYLRGKLAIDVDKNSNDFTNLFLLGSVLDEYSLFLNSAPDNSESVNITWGCGVRSDEKTLADSETALFFGVRGPRSAKALNLSSENIIGDPGLLLPLFYIPNQTQEKHTLIVPHFLDTRSDEEIVSAHGNGEILRPKISPKDDYFLEMVDKIANAKFVFAGALHAAVVACAYGIPFGFLDAPVIDTPIKWNDFAESIGIKALFHKSLEGAINWYHEIALQIAKPSVLIPFLYAPFVFDKKALDNFDSGSTKVDVSQVLDLQRTFAINLQKLLHLRDKAIAEKLIIFRERDELERTAEGLRRERDELERTAEGLRRERDELERTAEGLRRERDELERTAESLTRERDELALEVEELNRRILSILTSKSWRYTRIFRLF